MSASTPQDETATDNPNPEDPSPRRWVDASTYECEEFSEETDAKQLFARAKNAKFDAKSPTPAATRIDQSAAGETWSFPIPTEPGTQHVWDGDLAPSGSSKTIPITVTTKRLKTFAVRP